MSATFLIDVKNDASYKQSYFGTIASNATTNGTGVDLLTDSGPTHLIYQTGDVGDATTQVAIKIKQSDDNSTFTDVPSVGEFPGSVTLAGSATVNDNQFGVVTTIYRSKRYVRAVVTTSGGSVISVPIAVGFLGRKKITGTGNGAQL